MLKRTFCVSNIDQRPLLIFKCNCSKHSHKLVSLYGQQKFFNSTISYISPFGHFVVGGEDSYTQSMCHIEMTAVKFSSQYNVMYNVRMALICTHPNFTSYGFVLSALTRTLGKQWRRNRTPFN